MKMHYLRFAALATTGLMILNGCDPTIRQTVEDGIISSSTALLGSVFEALIDAATETAA